MLAQAPPSRATHAVGSISRAAAATSSSFQVRSSRDTPAPARPALGWRVMACFIPLLSQQGLRFSGSRSSSLSCSPSARAAGTAFNSSSRRRGLGKLRWRGGPWRRQALLVLGTLAAVAVRRVPAWASGMPAGPVAAIQGTLAHRVAVYTGVCGSLAADLMLATSFFVAFAVCAGTETAITTLWPWKVREYAQREREKFDVQEKERLSASDKDESRTASKRKGPVGKWTALREDIQRFMQTILIGATLSGVISTAFVTEICGQLFGPQGLAIATVSVSLVQLTLGEIVPKSMAVSNPYSYAQTTLPFFYRVSAFVYPASKFLNQAMSLMLKMFGISVDTNKTPYVTEEELDLIFSSAMQSGIVDAEEGEMIRGVRSMDTQKVKKVMTPLADMICIEKGESIEKLCQMCFDTQYSRIPVYEKRFDSIVGVVSMKALMRNLFPEGELALELKTTTVGEICDKPVFVPETMTLINALRLLKEKTLAICVDEYGGTKGLVSLEDVLEEIVGEIYDADEEKDTVERELNRDKIKEIAPDHFSMAANAEIDDVEEALGLEIPEGDYISIGGFVCAAMDRIPDVGEAVLVETAADIIRFEVSEADDRRVSKVEAYLSSKKGDGPEDDSETDSEDKSDEPNQKDQVLDVRLETTYNASDQDVIDTETEDANKEQDTKKET